jgi:hypothetical protein
MSLTDRDNYLRTAIFQGGKRIPTSVSISPACGCGSRQAINHPLNPELLGALLGPQALAGRSRKHDNGVRLHRAPDYRAPASGAPAPWLSTEDLPAAQAEFTS